MRTVPIEGCPTKEEWIYNLGKESMGAIGYRLVCDGCEANIFVPIESDINTDIGLKEWVDKHYYCLNKTVEVDDTLIDWISGG